MTKSKKYETQQKLLKEKIIKNTLFFYIRRKHNTKCNIKRYVI